MPVLAAGGIMDGRGLAAALALGADGVWTGTTWQIALEHDLKMPLKQNILNASQDETIRQKFLSGKTARVIKDRWVDAWLQPGAPAPLPMPLQMMVSMPITWAAEKAEKWDYTPTLSGQGVGMVKKLRSCREIMADYVNGALEVMEKFQLDER